jgi:hypothetical protein
MNLPESLVEKLDRLPPFVCRMWARRNGLLAPDVTMAKELGWSLRRWRRIARSTTFAKIEAYDIDMFLKACGLTWSSQRRARYYIRTLGNNIYRMRHLQPKDGRQAAMISRHKKRFEQALAKL